MHDVSIYSTLTTTHGFVLRGHILSWGCIISRNNESLMMILLSLPPDYLSTPSYGVLDMQI